MAPSKLAFLYDDLFREATSTASSEVSTLPVENVQDPIVDKVWRATGDTSEWLKFDLGSAKTIDTIVLIGHNITTSGTVTIQANTTDSWGTPAYSLASQTVWESGQSDPGTKTIARVIFLDSSQTYQWWRVVLADASNPDGYIEMGRCMGGEYFESAYNYEKYWRHARVDESEKIEVGSYRTVNKKNKYNKIVFDLSYIEDTKKYDEWLIMFEEVGIINDFILILDPTDAEGRNKLSFYGQWEESQEYMQHLIDRYKAQFIFRESVGDQFS